MKFLAAALLALLLGGCDSDLSSGDDDTGTDTDSDTDTDTDSDTDTDTDSDSDTGTDTDVDTDTDTDIVCDTDCPEVQWISILGGTFQMGSTEGESDETPVHAVTVPDFEMLETEVTVTQYAACVDATVCTTPNTTWDNCNWDDGGYEDHPVNCVDWYQAVAFCEWAGGRLPSEAEWEYSARSGGQDIDYPWGDEMPTCDYAVMDDDTHSTGCDTSRTWSVCSKTAGNTEQGLCDMSGNVWEWAQDVYHASYDCDANPDGYNCDEGGVAPTDGSAWEGSGYGQVVRGGSLYDAEYLRAANREGFAPSDQSDYLGLRCARDVD